MPNALQHLTTEQLRLFQHIMNNTDWGQGDAISGVFNPGETIDELNKLIKETLKERPAPDEMVSARLLGKPWLFHRHLAPFPCIVSTTGGDAFQLKFGIAPIRCLAMWAEIDHDDADEYPELVILEFRGLDAYSELMNWQVATGKEPGGPEACKFSFVRKGKWVDLKIEVSDFDDFDDNPMADLLDGNDSVRTTVVEDPKPHGRLRSYTHDESELLRLQRDNVLFRQFFAPIPNIKLQEWIKKNPQKVKAFQKKRPNWLQIRQEN